MKKFIFILIFLILLIISAFALSSALNHRSQLQQTRTTAKAAQISITLLEGWTDRDIAEYLQKTLYINTADFLKTADNFDLTAYPIVSQKPKNGNLEGFLFPDTYFLLKSATSTPEAVIKKALDNFSHKITPEMQTQSLANNMSFYQTLILASIIEKEGKSNADKKIISGIFYNRLKNNIALQSDATINYITHKNSPSLSLDDTKLDSPYNSYKYPGLPPTPICNPGLDSILAALYPQKNDYLYFLSDPKTGNAIFAKTYEEHLQNKKIHLK